MNKVRIDASLTDAIAEGYLEVVGDRLSPAERQSLFFSGWLITMEQAIRFLTDYLELDRYYGARYADHNLVRATNQLTLAQSMENLGLVTTTL